MYLLIYQIYQYKKNTNIYFTSHTCDFHYIYAVSTFLFLPNILMFINNHTDWTLN